MLGIIEFDLFYTRPVIRIWCNHCALGDPEFPRISHTGNPVSEKNSSRQPVNRSKLLECVLQFSLLIKCTLPKESCHAQQGTVGRKGSRHLCTPGGWGPTRAE